MATCKSALRGDEQRRKHLLARLRDRQPRRVRLDVRQDVTDGEKLLVEARDGGAHLALARHLPCEANGGLSALFGRSLRRAYLLKKLGRGGVRAIGQLHALECHAYHVRLVVHRNNKNVYSL